MRLTKVYVRFYKSFNFDYERKAHRDVEKMPWEFMADGSWYPFVRVDIEPDITTVVGANESGKSHLLGAIRKLVDGKNITWLDFCRHSSFFSAETGMMRVPDFGGEFEVVTPNDQALVREHLGRATTPGERFKLFRLNGALPVIYWAQETKETALMEDQADSLIMVLPEVFTLDPEIPLPDTVLLSSLTGVGKPFWGSRGERQNFLDSVARDWGSAEEIAADAKSIFESVSSARTAYRNDGIVAKQQELAEKLLFDVARVDREAIKTLQTAIAEGRDGFVNGVIDEINTALEKHLNFSRWWAQDQDFRLLVSPREQELAFTIRDRTGTDYSFKERSHGLTFFLSYFVQLRAHARRSPAPEVLLMDEPDAFLSSQGQQDLLRILEDFARPEDGSREDQVVYVTHSPFLINRNAGSRIRVLDKGVGEEGTRVVRDASQNHYEPLRTSLGPFVAETAFIGGTNLFVEGMGDQVLLAGMSSHLRALGTADMDTLNLNDVTIVAAGNASSVPYMVYLARGRDEIQPPCVVLLDGDDSGKYAVRTLSRGGAYRKQILDPKFVIQLSAWANKLVRPLSIHPDVVLKEPEDMIPPSVAVAAARAYAERVIGMPPAKSNKLREQDVIDLLGANENSLWDALEAAVATRLGDGAHIEKVGFAKEVVALATNVRKSGGADEGINILERNFEVLLAEIARRLRNAKEAEENSRLNNRLVRALDRFRDDHSLASSRQDGRILLETVENALEDTAVGDRIRSEVQAIRREFGLTTDLTKPIEPFDEFSRRVNDLRYIERFSNQAAALPLPGSVQPPPAELVADASSASNAGSAPTPSRVEEAAEGDGAPLAVVRPASAPNGGGTPTAES